MTLDMWIIKGGIKVFLLGSSGSVLTLFGQAVSPAPAVDPGNPLSLHVVSLIAMVAGPLFSAVIAILTMRRVMKKDRMEDKRSEEGMLHSSLTTLSTVNAEERTAARTVLLEIIEIQRKERDHLEQFYSTQLKEKQATIELQRALLEEVKTFAGAIAGLRESAGKLEAVVTLVMSNQSRAN